MGAMRLRYDYRRTWIRARDIQPGDILPWYNGQIYVEWLVLVGQKRVRIGGGDRVAECYRDETVTVLRGEKHVRARDFKRSRMARQADARLGADD